MDDRVQNVTKDLMLLADSATERFGKLSVDQLNWKPAPESWSVAQCLDHLITSHSLYFPLFEKFGSGVVKPTMWERWSPLSGFFGRLMIKIVDPENPKKEKTLSKAEPSTSSLDEGIVERFAAHQGELVDHIRRLPSGLDTQNTIVTSPFVGFITYSVDHAFTILVSHCKRHLGQAQHVMEAKQRIDTQARLTE